MKSSALLRTNVGLTTNIKIVVDSNYNLSLDSIDSIQQLSRDKYKKKSFNKDNLFDELIPHFFNGLPAEIAFSIKYDNDSDSMSNKFSKQYDELYQYGARNIISNKNYTEEFEYFAPLYISINNIPKKFIIFRADGAGTDLTNKESFKSNILNKLKVVKIVDLTKGSLVGEWLENSFKNNEFFPESPIEMDFRPLEFCRWNGIDYESGGYISKSLFMDDILDEEKEIFELERLIFDKWRESKVVFPNILNLSFLFDDEPSTPEDKNKWSLNRYYGFYIDDMIFTQTVSPYTAPALRSDFVILDGNILYSPTSLNPFVDDWSDSNIYNVEYEGIYYRVEKFEEEQAPQISRARAIRPNGITLVTEGYEIQSITKYRIISAVDLTDKQSLINKNLGYINEDNIIKYYDGGNFVVNNYDESDFWLIEIDGIFHKIIKEVTMFETRFKIISDYSFKFTANQFSYKIAGVTKSISTIVDVNNDPRKFNIYKLNFTDIKDFDTRIVDTEFSKYEYEKQDELTLTDESKMYLVDLGSNINPKPFDDFIYNDNVVSIPVSSEYTANHETFKIDNGGLSTIWRKNPVYCRWSFQNSLSSNDYPYVLNNSEIFEDFNRTVNPFDPDPSRIERNLDYFYTVNSSTSSYLHHSLHVERLNSLNDIDYTFKFELDKYLNLATYSVGTSSATYSFDYFSYFFGGKSKFMKGEIQKNTDKYSLFNEGDKYIPNITLFRGMKFFIYDLDSVRKKENGDIDMVNLRTSNTFDDYKFSILLSDNDLSVNNLGNLVSSNNMITWKIISDWEMDRNYLSGDLTMMDDILYETNTDVITENPTQTVLSKTVRSAPYNQSDWSIHTSTYSILWNPTKVYNKPSPNICDYIVYNHGEYYVYDYTGTDDFWNPLTASSTGYNMNDIVLYKGQYYASMTSSNPYSPDASTLFNFDNSKATWLSYWGKTSSVSEKWSVIKLWNSINRYNTYDIVIHNLVVYTAASRPLPGYEPGISSIWIRNYSLEPDTDFIYTSMSNPIIQMNDKYYLCTGNANDSTLDNGVVIYINKKWKNILININIADNTILNISEKDRDELYIELNRKLTASNFMNVINDIKNKYGFTDYVSYVIIDEDGLISKYKYNHNINSLPYMINCEGPEEIDIKVNSLIKTPIPLEKSLKPYRSLINGKINKLSELNYYNNTFVSIDIKENKSSPQVFDNYHGNKNHLTNKIYRFSGYYMPLLYNIQLFNRDTEYLETGNYLFDTTLTDFGIIKERIISKINRNGSILKLKDSKDVKSIYPMIDEFGYSTVDFFIFSSTWDRGYHVESYPNSSSIHPLEDKVSNIDISTSLPDIGQPKNI